MGRGYPGHLVSVIDDEGHEAPIGTPGEVAIRRTDIHGDPDPIFFLGYWNQPEATRAKFTGDWWRTGDVAVTELPVPGGGSIIAAFWTGPADGAALQAAAETGLARYKQPREFIHVDALPRTPTGKINRRALRAAHRKDGG